MADPSPAPIHMKLLGPSGAQVSGTPIHCASKKAFALFAFLAIERRPHSRRALATLFWGGRDAEASRASLRATLFRVPAPMAAFLAIDRDFLAVADSAALTSDVSEFETLAQGDSGRMKEAAQLYKGHLLEDFDPEATPEFDDWLGTERARLKHLAYAVFDRGIGEHYGQLMRGASVSAAAQETGLALARQWLTLEPAAERAHRWLMRLHLHAGRTEAAQAQYDICCRALAVAEGRAPSADTRALLSPASYDTSTGPPPAQTHREPYAPGNPAAPSTSFIGRVDEVAQITRLLGEPACRMLTLHGLGGVGKTRLAHSVMQQVASRFPDGATWVALEGVEQPAAVADAIARALGLELAPRLSVREALLQRLRSQTRLIVIDNLEHLLMRERQDDPVDLLLELLRVAPEVRLLVTSRETLGVQEEWVYDIGGLAYAADGQVAAQSAQPLPAVELFAQRARQAYLGFSLAGEMPHVLRICAQVEGLPLGIELAAAWIRTIPCAEISRELERSIDLPSSVQRNRPDRQRSLRAVIEFSWRLLASEQQNALAALSEFRGGFARDAAEAVAQASLRVLSTLVDKSLVRRASESRYSLHPLVRKFAAEKLARSRSRRSTTRARHAEFYLRLLSSQRIELYGPRHLQARQWLEIDLDNIRAAWAAKVESGDARSVAVGARPLSVILDRLGLHDEWTRTFDQALATFPQSASAEAQSAHRHLLIAAAYGHWRRGDAARARTYEPRLREIIETTREPSMLADLHRLLGLIARDAGDIEAGLAHLVAGAEAAKRAVDALARGHLANEIGVVHWRRGHVEKAREAFAESLALCESSANVFDAPLCLHNVAYCDLELGRFEDAEKMLERALAMCRDQSDLRSERLVLSSLGFLARRRGDFGHAESLARASLALAERVGSPGAVADAIDDLAQVLEKRGDFAQSESLYTRSLAMARELGQVHLQCAVLVHLARTQTAAGGMRSPARSLLEAVELANAHDFGTGRSMAMLGAADLRMRDGGEEASAQARRWCAAVLAFAGSNVDVKGAVPASLRDVADNPGAWNDKTTEDDLRLATSEVVDFLDGLANA